MGANKIPYSFFGLSLLLESLFKAPIGFVGRNNQVLLYGGCVLTALKLPCFLSKAETLATMNPASVSAVCILFHTDAFVLENSTVIHLPGLSTR